MINPSAQPVVLFGLNGAGKTNILEAISMLAPGQGFRRAKFSELSRRPDLLGWKVSAKFEVSGTSHEICTFWDETSSRKITIDGKPATQIALAHLVRILWITPLMDRIWLDGSGDRRRFLDRIVSIVVPDHTKQIIKYHKALKQRNKLIKDKNIDISWYSALERQMAQSGIQIDLARREVISQLVTMQKKSISSFPIADLRIIGTRYSSVEEFEEALGFNRKQDIYAGRTLIGPHLNDLEARYHSKAIDAKNCSTGEQKALLISIIIAAAKIQLELFNTPPILLFDEVSAHLDSERRSLLYDELHNLGLQVFLTGTDSNIFEELKLRAQYYKVELEPEGTVCTQIDDIFS